MSGRRFPIQDATPEVTAPTSSEARSFEHRARVSAAQAEALGVEGLAEIDRRLGEAPDASRSDAVATVEWRLDGWVARWVIARPAGGLVVRSLHLEALGRLTPDAGITADMLRSLSPSRAIAAATEARPRETDGGYRGADALLLDYADRSRDEKGPSPNPASARRPGRPRVEDAELEAIARAYLLEARAGAGLHARLAAQFQISPSTARDRIAMCRERGFLSPTRRGKRGAEAGPALRARDGGSSGGETS